ncbi:MAG: DUF58 domain-containing protein [Nitrospinae bacterium]|nr:DUF58 domain-containing protein [Nitrospinota bacterium]
MFLKEKLTYLFPFLLWKKWWFREWLPKRIPASRSITLTQKSIFILPSREGYAFTVILLIVLLSAINYQNSLLFASFFLLSSLFIVSILHTFRNLDGLTLISGNVQPVFAGEEAFFTIVLQRNGDRTYEALRLGWNENMMKTVDITEKNEERVLVGFLTKQRGVINPGRLLVETNYPVGLLRAWTWIDLELSCLVYPSPVKMGAIPETFVSSDDGTQMNRFEGADDFSGLRKYQAGDSLRNVAWKNLARGHGLHTKEFVAYTDRKVWLDWETFGGMDKELRLSGICFWVTELSRTGDEYGLKLPNQEISIGRGEEHRNNCLKALALFD